MMPCATGHSAVDKSDLPAGPDLAEAGSLPCHVVQFYETDVFLVATVADYLTAGLRAGQPVVVIATEAHREAFGARLRTKGPDIESAFRRGQITWLDARETLAAFMVDAMPDPERFRSALSAVLERSLRLGGHPTVRAYGEMVDLLCKDGMIHAALRLEELWNDLAGEYQFSLLCAYRMGNFNGESHGEGFRQVCRNHGQVVPTERYVLADETDRLTEIAVLQQRARALEAEVQRRKDLEQQLREALAEQERTYDELRRREQKLADAQRLESIGLLAGGIAHDFNNLLASVLGNADLLSERLPEGSADSALAQEIVLAAQRSADLTRQLLAYAGRGQFVLGPVDVGGLVREIASLLRTAIPAGGTLALDIPSIVPPVRGDRAQLTQVVMNLVTNAADAIKATGGTVTVAMVKARFDERTLASLAVESCLLERTLPAGDYVQVEVADTGVGMTPEVRARMFEPFFTTKATGRGLGLAATRGIVQAHGGLLIVDSALGRGTTARLWLPVDAAAAVPVKRPAAPLFEVSSQTHPRRTVLVADDEAGVRRTLARMLSQQGFEVLEAGDGKEALAVVEARAGEVDLVLLDLTMPRLGGAKAREVVAMRYPKIPVVLMSGYTEQPTEEQTGPGAGAAIFLEKPFERSTVMRAVAMALGGHRST
jgi:signal transduction histidine kinase/ActR/RegA family two-component response regulator